MAKLTIHDGGRSTIHEILDDSVLIGKKEGAAVRISDPSVGAEHCQIRNVPGVGYKLIDLESQEGTKVNGAFVNQHLLRDGDVIQIGQVRIGFSGEGGLPAAPARPAAGVGVKPAGIAARPAGPAIRADARPARPVRKAAMPARPRPRPGGPRPDADAEWEERPRRVSRQGSNAPIIILGVVVGLLVLGVLIILTAGQWYDHEHNQTVYYDMRDMFRAGRYQEAISIAADADPSGDPAYYGRIQQLESECRGVLATNDREVEHHRISLDYNKIEHFAKRNRNDKAAILAKWNEFIARHDGTPEPFHVAQAKLKRERLMSGGAGSTGPVAPTGDGKIDRAWRGAKQAADGLEKGDYFQKAINTIQDFWDNNQGLAAPGSGWDERVNGHVRAIESRARVQYEMIEGYAKQAVNRGEYPRAKEWYERIIERFGIESYRVRAREAMKKLP